MSGVWGKEKGRKRGHSTFSFDKLIHYAPDETPENLTDNDKLAEFDYTVREDGRRTGVVEKFWVDTGSGVEEVTNTVAWEYDELNRLIDEVFVTDADDLLDPVSLPDGTRAWTDYRDHYTYDLTGNRLEKTTDLGNNSTVDETVTYEYDSNDRLLEEVKDVASGTDTTTQYGFDHTQQTEKVVYEGLPSSLGDIQSSQDFQYDLSFDRYDPRRPFVAWERGMAQNQVRPDLRQSSELEGGGNDVNHSTDAYRGHRPVLLRGYPSMNSLKFARRARRFGSTH